LPLRQERTGTGGERAISIIATSGAAFAMAGAAIGLAAAGAGGEPGRGHEVERVVANEALALGRIAEIARQRLEATRQRVPIEMKQALALASPQQ
jgi:hypothetical protein